MKRFLIILPALFLTACAEKTPHRTNIGSMLPPSYPASAQENLRLPEEVREYRFGRYADPADRAVLHEAHPVYRVEQTARWNLRTHAVNAPASAASSTRQPNDAVVAEINQQKLATKTFTAEASTLNERLAALAQAVAQTRQVAEQQLLQQRDIAALKTRLNAVESQEASATPPSALTKPSAPEESW